VRQEKREQQEVAGKEEDAEEEREEQEGEEKEVQRAVGHEFPFPEPLRPGSLYLGKSLVSHVKTFCSIRRLLT